ncbi:MAG: hypothetical protein GX061_07415 [Eubacteriaceae bacterium]|nr:hypothetical protein [Eubacteriaceae bacterium]
MALRKFCLDEIIYRRTYRLSAGFSRSCRFCRNGCKGENCGFSVRGLSEVAEKPVGFVYTGIYYKGKTSFIRSVYGGNRQKVRQRAVAGGF